MQDGTAAQTYRHTKDTGACSVTEAVVSWSGSMTACGQGAHSPGQSSAASCRNSFGYIAVPGQHHCGALLCQSCNVQACAARKRTCVSWCDLLRCVKQRPRSRSQRCWTTDPTCTRAPAQLLTQLQMLPALSSRSRSLSAPRLLLRRSSTSCGASALVHTRSVALCGNAEDFAMPLLCRTHYLLVMSVHSACAQSHVLRYVSLRKSCLLRGLRGPHITNGQPGVNAFQHQAHCPALQRCLASQMSVDLDTNCRQMYTFSCGMVSMQQTDFLLGLTGPQVTDDQAGHSSEGRQPAAGAVQKQQSTHHP